jgi:hypothetical protein
MNNEKIQVIGIDLEDLKDLIRNAVKNELETCVTDCRFGTEFKDEILSRNDVAELLKMTPEKVTDGYNRKEIPGIKIGGEFRFQKSKIISKFK